MLNNILKKHKSLHAINSENRESSAAYKLILFFEKINRKKNRYELAARRGGGDLPSCRRKGDRANKKLCWKTKHLIDSMFESALKFNENYSI